MSTAPCSVKTWSAARVARTRVHRPGVDYLNNRYHDPTIGTFISVDPLVTLTGEPYIYASGNPIAFADPWGLFSCYVPDNPWACLDLSAIVTKTDATAPTNRLDPNAPSPTAVRLEDAPTTDFTVKWYDTAALAINFNHQRYIGPTVEHHAEGWNQIYYEDGTLGFGVTICPGLCVTVGMFDSHFFVGWAGVGVGASADAHFTSDDACAQQGASTGISYVYGGGGGVSVANSGSGIGWDSSNVDVTASVGLKVAIPALDAIGPVTGIAGGGGYTWVSGC